MMCETSAALAAAGTGGFAAAALAFTVALIWGFVAVDEAKIARRRKHPNPPHV